jgi:hypothetical protein
MEPTAPRTCCCKEFFASHFPCKGGIGVLVKAMAKTSICVPPGCAAWAKDQFAASEGSMSYVAIAFSMEALIGVLIKFMDASNYTMDLHKGLTALKEVTLKQDYVLPCVCFQRYFLLLIDRGSHGHCHSICLNIRNITAISA